MRGDEAQVTAGGGAEARGRSGPRHAAPKKSLLTKFHMPAGKALALAAMPTAVLVGMSLTPKLAMAAEEPGNPFAPGPCVTQPDEAGKDDAAKDDEAKGKDDAAKDEPGKDAEKDKPAKDEPAEDGKPDPAGPDATKPDKTPAPDGTKAPAETPTPEKKAPEAPATTPAPAETETKNPLDPLGVGPAIKDFFEGLGGKKEEPAPPAADPAKQDAAKPDAPDAAKDPAKKPDADAAKKDAEPAKKADKPDPKDDAEESKADKESKAEKDAKEAKDKLDKAAKDAKEKADAAAAKTEKAIKAAAEKLGIKVEDFDKDGDGKPDLVPNEDGQIPFPCPVADPDALANAKLEPGIPDLPDDPWILETSMLTLRGLDYAGVVEVRTAGGKIKKVLKFTAKETDIKDLHQTTVGPNGTTGHVQARKGSTSTLRQGTVTMYTEELKGNLFGLIPVTFSPQTPPPLNVPIAMFTKVKVTQAGQFGGTLTVPGLHNYFTGPGTGNAAAAD
ncbi:hypothetical protein GCM10010329_65050 [Streptomyces spiroverticillatus]|uniref:Hydrogenase expression protein HypF n=1 Tax=Streptomyces finlayi TaxID=67296 RepID=A0A918X475_9ACTN|nr:hypothetical protein [Streptomyces finlayi]GHA32645.1 hypothetical protein GCM10010329_65050 [Streptomyces spiroverticillatus]GHD10426.1 hypothetical protein GCM10010334_65510 [Streptomyces finlayi]